MSSAWKFRQLMETQEGLEVQDKQLLSYSTAFKVWKSRDSGVTHPDETSSGNYRCLPSNTESMK